ncbi:MAG: universal stress protein [Syntrophomonadaceae bacterium]|nr:universal stress protein [Syntrophomonadaceae bacterium]
MFKRILVAADGSEYSRQAFRTGLEVARRFDAEVQVLAVVEPSGLTGEVPLTTRDSHESYYSDKQGCKMLGQTMVGIDYAGVKLQTKIGRGRAADIILDELRRDFDLVVMGSRGHSPLGGALIGSVTQKVMGEAECPVLVAKKPWLQLPR